MMVQKVFDLFQYIQYMYQEVYTLLLPYLNSNWLEVYI